MSDLVNMLLSALTLATYLILWAVFSDIPVVDYLGLTWISIGLGVYLGLVITDVSIFALYPAMCIISGFLSTLIAWPVSLYTHTNRYRATNQELRKWKNVL